ncbi:MAG: urease accessory protein UreE [Cyanobacteria bacterium J06639_16]
MLVLTRRLAHSGAETAFDTQLLTLSLTADQRTRSRHRFTTDDGQPVHLQLPRGTVLHNGDVLVPDCDRIRIKILAKPEPVLTVTASTPLDLLRGAYHLGNRHVALEVALNHLRLAPDPVLETMLVQLGLSVTHDTTPFNPEVGAYGNAALPSHHPHVHAH